MDARLWHTFCSSLWASFSVFRDSIVVQSFLVKVWGNRLWAFAHSFLHHWSRCAGHSSHQMKSLAWGMNKSKSTSNMVITNGEFNAFFFCTDGDGMTNSYLGLVRLRWEHCRPSVIFWLWQPRWLCLVVTVGISAFYSFNYGGCIEFMVSENDWDEWLSEQQIDRESFFYMAFHILFSTFLS